MKNTIIIQGEEIDEEVMPALYRWAKVNPKGLEAVIKKTSEFNKEPVGTTMAIMESEYQTDNS